MGNDRKNIDTVRDDDPAMDRETQAELLESIAAIEPGAKRRAAMRQRILDRIKEPASNPDSLVTIRADEGEWVEITPAVHRKRLLRTDNAVADLIRMAPGSSIPGHEHLGAEECICLEGEVFLGDIVVRAGDFHFAPEGVPHGTVYSRTGCLLYVRTARGGQAYTL